MGDVIVPLHSDPFARFKARSKSVEVRNAASPVAAQVRKAEPGAIVRLRRGYDPRNGEILGRLARVALAHGFMELPAWARAGADIHDPSPARFFEWDADLVAFEVVIGEAAA